MITSIKLLFRALADHVGNVAQSNCNCLLSKNIENRVNFFGVTRLNLSKDCLSGNHART